MMRKLIILMLVFGISSIASATLQISVNGVPNPVDTEIWLHSSEIAILEVWTDADITPGGGSEGYFALAAKTADATIAGGARALADAGLAIYDDAVGVGGVPLPAGDNGVFGTIIVSELPLFAANSTLFDGILFHCDWVPNDVLVTLWYSPDFVAWNPVDTAVIHQIPEPATFLLFALGGLMLRRKR